MNNTATSINLPRIENIDVDGKTVFLRVDWNLPLDKKNNFKVTDSTRLEKSAPTIKLLHKRGAKIIISTHLGRPKGKKNPDLSTEHVLEEAINILGIPVKFCPEVSGSKFTEMVKDLKSGEALLIENVRFDPAETKNGSALADKWAEVSDIYINDAFGSAHRAHASTEAIAHKLPAYAGLLLQKEVDTLSSILKNPARPFVAIIGGAKVSSKLGVLKNLINKVDTILIGGGMSYTFLKSRAIPIGNSLFEQDQIVSAFQVMEKAELEKTKLLLPEDHVIGSDFSENTKSKVVGKMGIADGWLGMDIGPKTIDLYEKEIKNAGTVLWNGPMGVFEFSKFAKGTNSIAKAIAKSKAISVVGGGDSLAALHNSGVSNKITHVSTGGGASLEFLEGKSLPGISALLQAKE